MTDTDLILTDDEIKNGWTKETLRAYIIGRQTAQERTIHTKKVRLPNEQNHKYNSHNWRR